MHLTLHPADARIMIEAGWGERHPLARGGWLERFVPRGFVMVYAPRTQEEIFVVLQLVRAAAWWVGGDDIKVPVDVDHDGGGVGVRTAVHSDAYHDANRSSSIASNHALLGL